MIHVSERRQTVVNSLMKGVSERVQKSVPTCSKEGVNQGGFCASSF